MSTRAAARAELIALRRRFAAALPPARLPAAEVALALELRDQRRAVVAAIGPMTACSGCTAGYPGPFGVGSGGSCCGGRTADRFGPHEVASLRAAGLRPRQLKLPAEALSGCAFRAPDRCVLPPDRRPNVCTAYICRELERELAARGALDAALAARDRLVATFDRFIALRTARIDAALLAGQDFEDANATPRRPRRWPFRRA